tara:strand:- start:887 stop:1471 length:585 start_codon:yes stop_codon:yes gene_type:complete
LNTEYFFIDEFLDSDTLQKITADKPLVETSGYLITPDGSLKEDETNPTLCNRYDDNSIVKSLLPKSNGKLIDLIESQLKSYLTRPVIYNYRTLINNEVDPMHTSGRWHKDYNPIENFDDTTKQWITFFTLSSDNVNSEFQVSYADEWPDIWKRGVKETLSNNRLFAHNMNLGHQYYQNDNNDVTMIYIRWYDKG